MAVDPYQEMERQGTDSNTTHLLTNQNWPQYQAVEKTVTFDGGTENGIGDEDGTNNPYTLLSVTGTVELSIIALCSTNLAGNTATVELGTSADTAELIAQTTATDIDAGEIWHDASPDSSVELTSVAKRYIVNDDVILTVGTANVTAGVIKFIVK